MYSETAELYDEIYAADGKDYEREAEYLLGIALARLRSDSKAGQRSLLDVACGTGRHLSHFESVFEVQGLDLNEGMVAIARKRTAGRVHVADMQSFAFGEKFDVVTCLFSSIAYNTDEAGLHAAVQRMADHLTPGGVLIAEPWLQPDEWDTEHVGIVVVEEPSRKIARINRSGLEGSISLVDLHYFIGTPEGVESRFERHRIGLYSWADYVAAFEAAGLEAEILPPGDMPHGVVVGTLASRIQRG